MATHNFLGHKTDWAQRAGFGFVHEHMPTGFGVTEAREICCNLVEDFMLNQPDKKHWVLWLDDDMAPSTLHCVAVLRHAIEASEIMQERGESENCIGVLNALYSRKEDNDPGMIFSPKHKSQMLPVVDYDDGDIVEVEWCALGFTMHRAEWLTKLDKPRFTCNDEGSGEDHNFTMRLREAGCIPYVHTGLHIGHYCVNARKTFFPYRMPPIKSNGQAKVEA
jgi:hypothetical protein